MIEIVWSSGKNKQNLRKHQTDFEEAKTVFDDPMQISINDPDHSFEEKRYITFGVSDRNRLLIVAHTFSNDRIRIITARKPTRRERKKYEEGEFDA